MKLSLLYFVVIMSLLSAKGTAQGKPRASNLKAATSTGSSASKPAMPSEILHNTHTGEQVFQANCARCHMAPATLPPKVTGTVILHMRVRARLSEQDEKLLLRYLAP
ncbi:MAG: cytochrome c [Acidobacteriaceae bacterium]|nr:cytochrome c [Acidobacteriaceae bacterium]